MAGPLQTLQHEAMRAALKLPPQAVTRMFGPAPVNDRGTPLDLQTHTLLSLIRKSKQPEVHQLRVRDARRYYDDATIAMDVKAPWEVKTFHGFVSGKRPVAYEVYRPHHVKSRYAPAIVFFHGGGFVIGSAQGHASICKYIAHATDCVVINVDYALAPENPFPAGVEDAVRAFAHMVEHRRELGIDDKRIFVMGDSAGANLSINVSQHQILTGAQLPFAQILFFPTTDEGTNHASRNTFSDGFLLSKPLIDWFTNSYLGSTKNIVPDDHRVMPLHFQRTSELPQTLLLTCGFDPLRDEGEAYASKLNAAGVALVHRDAQNMIHGFFTMGGVLKTAKNEIDRIVPQIQAFLDDGRAKSAG